MEQVCHFWMKIVGEGLKKAFEFVNVLDHNYDYDKDIFLHDRHIGGHIFDVTVEDLYIVEGKTICNLSGKCNPSVFACMFGGKDGYYVQYRQQYGDKSHSTTLPIESKRLDLDIEVFSENLMVGFAEHFIVRKGKLILHECCETAKYDISQFESKEEAEEALGIAINDEQEDCSIIHLGGFNKGYQVE